MTKSKEAMGSIIVPDGCFPEDHERATAEVLKAAGKHITFLIPRRQPGLHTPDIIMDGKEWEIKCPTGKTKRGIKKRLKEASRQSKNIILDLSRCKLNEHASINEVNYLIKTKQYTDNLIVIFSSGMISYRLTSRK